MDCRSVSSANARYDAATRLGSDLTGAGTTPGLSIGGRVAIGFAIVLALLAGVGATGFWGMDRARGSISDLGRWGRETIRLIELNGSFDALRRNVVIYLRDDAEGVLPRVAELRDRIGESLRGIARDTTDPELRRSLTAIGADLANLEANLDVLVAKRGTRSRLIEAALSAVDEPLRAGLDQAIDRAMADGNFTLAAHLSAIETLALRLRIVAGRDLTGAEIRPSQDIQAAIEGMRDAIRRTRGLDSARPLTALLRGVDDQLGTFEFGFRGAMSSQAEVVLLDRDIYRPLAERIGSGLTAIRDGRIKGFDLLGDNSRHRIGRATFVSAGLGLAGLIAGLVLAWRIGRSIATPVRDMTAAMRRLAGGDHGIEIPARERRDELGAMAEAVQVFKTNATDMRRLMNEQARLASIVETSDDAIVSKSLDGTIVTWNAGAERLFGYAAAEMVGKSMTLLTPSDRAETEWRVLVRATSGETSGNYETVRLRKGGSPIAVQVAVSPIKDAGGWVIGVSDIARDVSRLKQTEQELRDREARIGAVLRTAIDGIVTIDQSGIVETFNPAAERIFGYAAAEVVGRNVKMLMPDPYTSEHDRYIENFRNSGKARIIGIGREVVGRRKDGSTFPLDLGVGEMRISDSVMFTGIVRDITERKQAERAKAEFVSTVSHELRTPLTSIKGSLGLVRSGVVGALPEKLTRMIEIAHNNSDRLMRLINDILDIEKIAAGKMEFHMRPIELSEFVEHAIEANRAYGSGRSIVLSLTETVPGAWIEGDQDRLMQVLANLLSNAAKFSPDRGTVEVAVRRHGAFHRILVTDHGPGIPEEFCSRIFQRFAQADSSDTRKMGGSGLGLSIARAIVERHGGAVGFETRLGKGSTFHIDLPARAVPSPDTSKAPAAPLTGPRVLVVEDDRDIATLLKMMLETDGLSADIAATAAEAKQRLRDATYAAMTLDLMLPDQDGIALMRELREAPATRDLPIVVVSAKAEDGAKRVATGEAMGVIDWMPKPIDQARLSAGVRKALSGGGGRKPVMLHVEDDDDICSIVATQVGELATVVPARTVAEARRLLSERRYDLVLLDLMLPDGYGEDLLPILATPIHKGTPVIVFSVRETRPDLAASIETILTKARTSNETLLASIRSAIAGRGKPG
ncbi:MAG: PAS domain S-box protein [Alphaproteobacteria bacterium]|nr:PAS domain S-box protein [Alphaproteobacteria bacterium]